MAPKLVGEQGASHWAGILCFGAPGQRMQMRKAYATSQRLPGLEGLQVTRLRSTEGLPGPAAADMARPRPRRGSCTATALSCQHTCLHEQWHHSCSPLPGTGPAGSKRLGTLEELGVRPLQPQHRLPINGSAKQREGRDVAISKGIS